MTPEEIALVRAGAEALRPNLSAVAQDFYRRLFAADPELRTMFTSDPVLQREKFADELEAIVSSIERFDDFIDRTRLLGARHAGYGVRFRHYGEVREALFGAFAAALGAGWTAETERAWRRAYDMIAEAMLLGSAPTRPQRTWPA
ncbi:globin domain-containing protein [Micromonospora sp. NBC_01412]|uniref:globin domain-containing protein n=1 Tax=Micromonospora sp. NBC_01412 TaxID=2903590 RepID=UPI00324AF135